jgi:hypothetical protein
VTGHLPESIATQVPGWLTARRYAVPAWLVAQATQRRAAGDWRGACAAAGVDVAVDLAAIRDGYGTELAERVQDDLRQLVPDLVRWHVPRNPGDGTGLFTPSLTVVLASYPDTDLALSVRTPAHMERPQRLTLQLRPVESGAPRWRQALDQWDTARYLWDARATGELLYRLGGGDRAPFHHRDGRRLAAGELPRTAPGPGDPVALAEWVTLAQDAGQISEAWAAAGVEADFTETDESQRRWRYALPSERYAMVDALVRAVSGQVAGDVVLRSSRYRYGRHVILTVDGQGMRARLRNWDEVNELPAVPAVWWRRFPDLELLRLGLLDPAGLHPLVREALFPDEAPDPEGYRPRSGAEVVAQVPVRCRGQWHRVGWRDGRVDALSHDPAEARRERAMRSLGGAVPACFTVTEAWRGQSGRLPRSLRELRWHALCLVNHGDLPQFERLLDLGVDPAGIRDRRGRNPLHLLTRLGRPELVPRLVAAGLDINELDAEGRTPLINAVMDGAPAALVQALLDAQADATVVDAEGCTALHLLRCVEADAVVPLLVKAGLALETRDMMGRTPLLTLFQTDAPAQAFRALLDAGADPTVVGEYEEQGVGDLISQYRRDDLQFLLDAYAVAGGGGDGD